MTCYAIRWDGRGFPTLTMDTSEDIQDVSQRMEELDFNHPFTPYDVQEQFMKAVYNVLETGDGQIGILESPTGTVSKWR